MAGLLEYMQQNKPLEDNLTLLAPEKPAEPEEVKTLEAWQQDTETRGAEIREAERLKESIKAGLEQGEAPQVILLKAIKAIGLYSGEADFCADLLEGLRPLWEDYAQDTLFIDKAAEELEALKTRRQEAREKMKKSLEKWAKACGKDIKRVNSLYAQLDTDPEEEDPDEVETLDYDSVIEDDGTPPGE